MTLDQNFLTGVKSKGANTEIETHRVAVPEWLAKSDSFRSSVLQSLMATDGRSSESFLTLPADPFGMSSESLKRLLTDVTRSWMDENLAEPGIADPETYLFDSNRTEAVPAEWLEHLFSLPVRDDHTLVMDEDSEL